MDVFDVFGDADSIPAAPPLLPRASEHPHFAVCRSLWPRASGREPPDNVRSLLLSYLEERSEACARGLRKSRSQYGRACAKSLLGACEAFSAEGDTADDTTLWRHACACVDLCATAIEESNWDVDAWHESNLIALALQISVLLHATNQAAASDEGDAADDTPPPLLEDSLADGGASSSSAASAFLGKAPPLPTTPASPPPPTMSEKEAARAEEAKATRAAEMEARAARLAAAEEARAQAAAQVAAELAAAEAAEAAERAAAEAAEAEARAAVAKQAAEEEERRRQEESVAKLGAMRKARMQAGARR